MSAIPPVNSSDPSLCPIKPLPPAQRYGDPHGFGYVSPVVVGVIRSPNVNQSILQDASLTAELGTDGRIENVTINNGGQGYQLGDVITFTGGGGVGATAYVSGVTGGVGGMGTLPPGQITEISFPPNGLPQQMLAMISGAGMPPMYETIVYPGGLSTQYLTIPNSGVIGAFNDKVTGYYNQSSMYQNQIEDIVAALNAISSADPQGSYGGTNNANLLVNGGGTIGGLMTSWWTYSAGYSLTGSLYTSYYTMALPATITIRDFLQTYATIPLSISESGTSAQQLNIQNINSGLSPYQSKLGTANSFLNSAVTTLQSQISQFSQIISQFFNAVQGVAGNIR